MSEEVRRTKELEVDLTELLDHEDRWTLSRALHTLLEREDLKTNESVKARELLNSISVCSNEGCHEPNAHDERECDECRPHGS